MEKQQIDMWVMSNNDKLLPEQMLQIRSKLEQISEDKFTIISSVELKSPTIMLIVSLLVGGIGIDRFMLGQKGMGILKLLTLGCFGILAIIDWFKIQKMTKDYNFKKIMLALSS